MPAIELKHLKSALAVADHGGIRRAAAALRLTQSNVSAHLIALEAEVGVALFDRSHSGAHPTSVGRDFLHEVRRSLDLLELAVTRAGAVGSGQTGNLQIGVFESFTTGFARELLTAFNENHRSATIRLTDGRIGDHFRRVRERESDIAFVMSTEDWSEEREKFWEEHLYVAVPETHSLSASDSVALTMLRKETILVQDREPEIRDFILARVWDNCEQSRVAIHDLERQNILALVAVGSGVTLVAESLTGIVLPGVKYVRLEGESVSIYAVWLRENSNPLLYRFLSMARSIRDGSKRLPR